MSKPLRGCQSSCARPCGVYTAMKRKGPPDEEAAGGAPNARSPSDSPIAAEAARKARRGRRALMARSPGEARTHRFARKRPELRTSRREVVRAAAREGREIFLRPADRSRR